MYRVVCLVTDASSKWSKCTPKYALKLKLLRFPPCQVSVPRRTSTASSGQQCSPPGLNRKSEDMPDRTPERMSEDMPERMSENVKNQKEFQKECRKICQNECQKDLNSQLRTAVFQKICQKECQNICKKDSQKISQKECQKTCQKDFVPNIICRVWELVLRMTLRVYRQFSCRIKYQPTSWGSKKSVCPLKMGADI